MTHISPSNESYNQLRISSFIKILKPKKIVRSLKNNIMDFSMGPIIYESHDHWEIHLKGV